MILTQNGTTLSVTGGTGPYTWNTTGTIFLDIAMDGTEAVLVGNGTGSVTVTDSLGDSQSITITGQPILTGVMLTAGTPT